MVSDFDETITTHQRLRELTRQPSSRAQAKVIAHIDDICRRFIAASPFLLVASRGPDGRLDISPRGDPPGFVAVLDEKTLAIPDRPGNNRFDTFANVIECADVALIFMIPGHGDTSASEARAASCETPRCKRGSRFRASRQTSSWLSRSTGPSCTARSA